MREPVAHPEWSVEVGHGDLVLDRMTAAEMTALEARAKLVDREQHGFAV